MKLAKPKGSAAAHNRTTTHRPLDQVEAEVVVAEIKYHDGPILLPNGMSLDGAIDVLEAKREYLGTLVNIDEVFDVFPWDGANALTEVMTEIYGWAPSIDTPTFWGPEPPTLQRVAVGFNEYKEVPWGRFSIPGAEGGYLDCGYARSNAGRYQFKLTAAVLRKDEALVRKLFTEIRNYTKESSIYRGKAIKMRFLDDNGKPLPMPDPQFMNTDAIDPNGLIYAEDVQTAVEVNLFTPILRVKDLLNNGMSVKRGVLLGGTYGTGKTLAATVASKHAVDSGITYLYVPRADELHLAVEFAKQYQSPACVVFCEDIDRVLNGERTASMDDLLNIIDGIDTKHSHIITVLTTNDLTGINAAMLRPGRLDAVIEVTPPDAKAVEKLIRHYGGEAVEAETDLTEAGQVLEGNIPATIAEVVKRAKLAELRLIKQGQKVKKLSGQAIVDAAKSMAMQLKLLADQSRAPEPLPTLDQALRQSVEKTVLGVLGNQPDIDPALTSRRVEALCLRHGVDPAQ